tara:strand:+ start:1717 stop:1968 length:252 start_codon:yes stop_codon:yes gene_type:complete
MTDGDVERYDKMISKRLLASFVEEVGADAVVVVYSKSDGEHTSVQMGRFGNVLTCVGLVDWIQDKFTEGYENMRDEQDPEDIA